MKKLILSALAVIISMSMFAVEGETAAYQIDVYVGTENVDNIFLSEAPFYTDGFDNMYDAYKAPMGKDTLICSMLDGKQLSVVARPNLAGTLITFQANESTNYKLKVTAEVAREGLGIYDHQTNQLYNLTNGTEIEFTQDAKTKAANRFEIVVPEFKVCVTFDQIEIYNNTGTDNIVVTNMVGEKIVDEAPTLFQVISMSNQPSGHYFLTVNGETYEFCNKPVSNN